LHKVYATLHTRELKQEDAEAANQIPNEIQTMK